MPNQRNRPVKRVVTPGFFGALKDAVGAVGSFIKPRAFTDRPARIEGVMTIEEKKRAQHRTYGNTP